MLMEYMDMGNLRNYLVEHGANISQEEKLSYCVDVAAGLAYLISKGIVHRDIAARNVLLTSSPEKGTYSTPEKRLSLPTVPILVCN